MSKSINLIINVLTYKFSGSAKNTQSDAAKFAHGLYCLGKWFGEKCGLSK